MRVKRLIAILSCGTILTASLTACGGGSGLSSDGKGSGDGSVTWWTWSTEATDAFTQQIEFAENENPDLKVDIQYTANEDYWTKLPVAISGGTGPDLYQMTRPSFELYAASGQAMDLTEIIEESEVISDYLDSIPQELRETYQFDGKQMAIPFSMEATAIAYNKDLFDEAGIDLKSMEDTWTWDDLREIANKMTVKDESGEIVQYGFYTPADRLPAWEMIWSHGDEMFDENGETCTLNQPGIEEALQPLVDMYATDGVSPNVEATASTSGDDMFISGKIAMIAAGIWKIPSYNNITTFNWDVVEIPFDPTTGERVSSSNVLGFVINPETKNLDATVALLEELLKPECQQILADTHTYIPALESVRSGYFEGDVPENIKAYENALTYVHPNTLTQYIPYAQFLQIFTDGLKNAYTGKTTLKDALKTMEDEINKIMEENKSQF